jgi:Lon protease-like protein
MSDAKERAGKRPAEDRAPIAWLEALEARVRDAVERLASTTAENARLRKRIARLEARLAEAGEKAPEGAPGDEERAAWGQEREEVRRRVDRLTGTLEALLADGGD